MRTLSIVINLLSLYTLFMPKYFYGLCSLDQPANELKLELVKTNSLQAFAEYITKEADEQYGQTDASLTELDTEYIFDEVKSLKVGDSVILIIGEDEDEGLDGAELHVYVVQE